MGPRGNHNGGPGGDFFPPNMNHNRFNQPTSLMQMRIPPPWSTTSSGTVGHGKGTIPDGPTHGHQYAAAHDDAANKYATTNDDANDQYASSDDDATGHDAACFSR